MLLFRNVKHSSALVNLRVVLIVGPIPVSSVPRATLRTLKHKKPKKSKNLNFCLKALGFYLPWYQAAQSLESQTHLKNLKSGIIGFLIFQVKIFTFSNENL